MRRVDFETNRYYHLFNRGVEEREIFVDNEDCVRFLEYLRKFKDTKEKPYLDLLAIPQVTFAVYCLTKDHFHLIARQESEDGITNLMHQLGTAFSMYFNRKYDRRGRLFEGPFRAAPITSEAQLLTLSKNIHLCPLRRLKTHDRAERIKFLRGYLWSSYQDYIGIRAGTLCKKEIVWRLVDGNDAAKQYQTFAESGLTEEEKKIIKDVVLE